MTNPEPSTPNPRPNRRRAVRDQHTGDQPEAVFLHALGPTRSGYVSFVRTPTGEWELARFIELVDELSCAACAGVLPDGQVGSRTSKIVKRPVRPRTVMTSGLVVTTRSVPRLAGWAETTDQDAHRGGVQKGDPVEVARDFGDVGRG